MSPKYTISAISLRSFGKKHSLNRKRQYSKLFYGNSEYHVNKNNPIGAYVEKSILYLNKFYFRTLYLKFTNIVEFEKKE